MLRTLFTSLFFLVLLRRYRWYRRWHGGRWELWYVDFPICEPIWHEIEDRQLREGYRPGLCRGTPAIEDWRIVPMIEFRISEAGLAGDPDKLMVGTLPNGARATALCRRSGFLARLSQERAKRQITRILVSTQAPPRRLYKAEAFDHWPVADEWLA
jgi:hypothetical protein